MSSMPTGSILIPYWSLSTDGLLNMGLCTQGLSRIRWLTVRVSTVSGMTSFPLQVQESHKIFLHQISGCFAITSQKKIGSHSFQLHLQLSNGNRITAHGRKWSPWPIHRPFITCDAGLRQASMTYPLNFPFLFLKDPGGLNQQPLPSIAGGLKMRLLAHPRAVKGITCSWERLSLVLKNNALFNMVKVLS